MGQLIRVEPACVRNRIQCLKGRLRITQTGLNRDILLAAGDSFETGNGGPLVIEALEAACFAQLSGF